MNNTKLTTVVGIYWFHKFKKVFNSKKVVNLLKKSKKTEFSELLSIAKILLIFCFQRHLPPLSFAGHVYMNLYLLKLLTVEEIHEYTGLLAYTFFILNTACYSLTTFSLITYIKTKVAFFNQSELFESFLNCSDWLDKIRPFTTATFVLIM